MRQLDCFPAPALRWTRKCSYDRVFAARPVRQIAHVLDDWRALLTPLPSLKETAVGLYLERRLEKKLLHADAFSQTVSELLELFPGLTALQANLVTISAVREASTVLRDKVE